MLYVGMSGLDVGEGLGSKGLGMGLCCAFYGPEKGLFTVGGLVKGLLNGPRNGLFVTGGPEKGL